MPIPHTAYIGLGANMAQPVQQLQRAIDRLQTTAETRVSAVSQLYQSAPYGGVAQDDFVNAVIKVETQLSAIALLRLQLLIERDLGRVRTQHWGPRSIDLDLLSYDNEQWRSRALTLPHPEIAKRRFVLLPLHDINPTFVLNGQPLSAIIAACEAQQLRVLDDLSLTF